MNSMYYNNLYSTNHSNINQNLFDVNKQIASGLKIQYASDDVATFAETMRLDNEITTLGQVKKSADTGYRVSNQTDITLNQFTDALDRMKVLLVNASNDTNDETSIDAIAGELRGIEGTLKSLSNISINGKYLFSGSAVNVKPIDDNGKYQGNDSSLTALLGSNNEQAFNISGSQLFLGEETLIAREITSNVVNTNLLEEYPALQASPADTEPLSSDSTIRNLMGDTDNIIDATATAEKHYFYLRGTSGNGIAFKEKIVMKDEETIEHLLLKIGEAYGNTGNAKLVNVSMNDHGQIVVQDKFKGSSKLDFHMVGATDFSDSGLADVTDIDLLNSGTTDFDAVVTTPGLFVKEFVKSNMTSSAGGGVILDIASSLEGIVYDRTEFAIDGSTLSSTVPQIIKDTNAFATGSTKLSEVADLSQAVLPATDTLDGTTFKFAGKDIDGNDYNVEINLNSTANGGSTFTVGGTPYAIFDMSASRAATDADEVTYQQLMDVMNMVITGNTPDLVGTNINPNTGILTVTEAEEYDIAIEASKDTGNTYLSYDGKIEFRDLTTLNTDVTIALYDENSDAFTTDGTGKVTDRSSVMTFNANNALTIRDAKTDFFTTISEAIKSVEEHKTYPDASSGTIRNLGMENSIATINDLQKHVFKIQSVAGAQSNRLTTSIENTEILELSAVMLRSEVIDTDLAEAALRLQQLTLNQQAMLSTVGKVSQLSLVNYL